MGTRAILPVLILTTSWAVAPSHAVLVKTLRVDGTVVEGEWMGCPDANNVSIRTAQGLENLAIDEVARVSFDTQARQPDGSVVFHLADGGRLYGDLVGTAPEAVVTRTVLGGSVPISFDRLAAIQFVWGSSSEKEFTKAEELFRAALQTRLPGQDVLITRGPEETTSLRGRLETLEPNSGSFQFGDRTRTFQTDKMFGVVFAAGTARQAAFPVTLELSDGSVVSGSLELADSTKLKLAASVGSAVELKTGDILRLIMRSPRVVYVSDLTPAAERTEGRLHRPWPIRKDQSVSAGALSIDGRAFDKGLGVHSKTELDFQIDGAYESLVATIGIDDAVRPSGSVVFRVQGDGKVLFDSGVLTGQDAPRDVKLDVTSVKLLTLVVDYGDGLDLSDQADWGGLRLLKPAPRVAAPPNR